MTNIMTSPPAHVRIAEQLGVSRMTVRKALATLQLEGRIFRRTGRSGGTFVAEELPEVELSSMRGFMGQLSGAGAAAGLAGCDRPS